MSQVSRSVLRGILEPDPRMEWWPEESGEYTSGGTRLGGLPSGGPQAGVPVPTQRTSMVLQATGDQAQNSALSIRTLDAGFGDGGGASFVWQRDGDGDSYGWRGHDVPNVVAAWEAIDWTSTAAIAYANPTAVVCEDGTIVVVADSGPAGSNVNLECFIRDPDTGVWSNVTVTSLGLRVSLSYPSLCLLPSGRILLFHWTEDSDAEIYGITMRYSDDQGQTWTKGTSKLQNTRSYATGGSYPRRIRSAYKDGQILVLAAGRSQDSGLTYQDFIFQCVSTDGGATLDVGFPLHNFLSGTDGASLPEVVVWDGHFVVAFIDSATAQPVIQRITSAYEILDYTSEEEVDGGLTDWVYLDGTGKYVIVGDLCLAVSPAGTLYLSGHQVVEENEWPILYSSSGGDGWSNLGTSPRAGGLGCWWYDGDSSSYPDDACAVWHQGRLVFIHSHASSASYDRSLSASYVGGYSTVTMPSLSVSRTSYKQQPWEVQWLPYDEPDDVGWTLSTTGTPTASISTGVLVLTGSILEAIHYAVTPTATIATGIIASCVVGVPSGTAEFSVRVGSGSEGYRVVVYITHTTVSAYDAVAATLIDELDYVGDEVQVLVALEDGAVRVWARPYDTTSDRAYALVAYDAGLTDDKGSTFTTSRVRWGMAAGDSTTRTHSWRHVAYIATDTEIGHGLVGQTSWQDLMGRKYASVPTYVADGASIRAVSGPTIRGDEWTVETRYSYPTSHLLPTITPSRRRVWRSGPISGLDGSTDYLHLAWRLDGDGAGDVLDEDSGLLNDLMALYLDGLNCPTVKIDLYYGGAWHNVTTTSVHVFQGTREGNTVRPVASSTFGGKWRLDEAAQSGIGFYNSAYLTCSWTGKIASNTEGITNTSAGVTKIAKFRLAETDSSSTTSPYVGIWPRRYLLVIHPSGYDSAITGLRLRIPVVGTTTYPGQPADGYYEVGKVAFGHVHVPGQDYNWDRSVSIQANVEVSTAADGSRRTRVLGPALQTIEVNWADGIDVSDARSSDTPDYLMGSANSGAEPVAWAYDVPEKLQDLVRHLDGPDKIVVLLPSIAYDSASSSSGDKAAYTTDFARGALYGRITSPVRIEQVVGEELDSEVYRVTTIEISEEP